MALRLVQFLAIMLTALALVLSGVHLAALPNKMAMEQADYFAAQQLYAGLALFGIGLFGASHTKRSDGLSFRSAISVPRAKAVPIFGCPAKCEDAHPTCVVGVFRR